MKWNQNLIWIGVFTSDKIVVGYSRRFAIFYLSFIAMLWLIPACKDDQIEKPGSFTSADSQPTSSPTPEVQVGGSASPSPSLSPTLSPTPPGAPTSLPLQPQSCTGRMIAGFCYHLGQVGQSCVDTCGDVGKYNDDGTRKAVASNEVCNEIVNAFGFPNRTPGLQCSDNINALGCTGYINADGSTASFRCSETPDPNGRYEKNGSGARRVCACNN
jgi:hypothetical protein